MSSLKDRNPTLAYITFYLSISPIDESTTYKGTYLLTYLLNYLNKQDSIDVVRYLASNLCDNDYAVQTARSRGRPQKDGTGVRLTVDRVKLQPHNSLVIFQYLFENNRQTAMSLTCHKQE